ncbi:MAG: AAA family ATPase [Bacteroidota bacterium]|nr:AAA family ATPase [Bacteroidota bacterium]
MPAIDWITIKGFKSLASIERLPLRQINILIGANGAGKSNFIEALDLFRATINGELLRFVLHAGGAEPLLHFGKRKTSEIHLQWSLQDERIHYEIELGVNQGNILEILKEVCTINGLDDQGQPLTTRINLPSTSAGVNYHRDSSKPVASVRAYLEKMWVYHFHDAGNLSPMKNTPRLHDNRFLHADGANLAAFLYLLRARYEHAYDAIRSTIRLAVPFLEDFKLEPVKLNPNTIRLEWRHRGSRHSFDISSLSDGTLRFIALVTLLLQPPETRPPVIMLDEPELGLHPMAIDLLAALIDRASAGAQIIVATQSSHLIDHFDPEDVVVADRVKGATMLSRLQTDKLKGWLEEYSLGQLWENNEFDGCPCLRPLDEHPYQPTAAGPC